MIDMMCMKYSFQYCGHYNTGGITSYIVDLYEGIFMDSANQTGMCVCWCAEAIIL
jgi:hypothetical protein